MKSTYLLLCPESEAVRYVGITKVSLKWRLSNHLSEARCGHKRSRRCSWIRGLLQKGLAPLIRHDVDVPDGANWEDIERARIAHYRDLGAILVNGTDGGIGLFKPTLEVRIRMRKKHRLSEDGLARQVENAKRTGAKNRGRKKSDAERAAMTARYTGRKASEETLLKMSKTRKGRKYSEEHRAAIRAGKLRYEAARREAQR